MSRIRFKAFSNCSIMDEDAEIGDLYAWQSILKARNVVGLGSTWGIGDGQKVEIRGDSWLPEGKVISPQKSLPLNARVCTLMDEGGPRWLEDRISIEFLPQEAKSILSLPQVTDASQIS